MKSQILLCICVFYLLFTANATIHTVSADLNHPAQYTTLQAAHDAANAGDTIQFYSLSNAPTLTISKRLVIVGDGYTDLPEYGPTLIFTAASNGSILMDGAFYTVRVSADCALSIRNCFIRYFNNSSADLVTDIIAIQCILQNISFSATGAYSSNLSFHNCIFIPNTSGEIQLSTLGFIEYNHCNFMGAINENNFFANNTFLNSIFLSANADYCNNSSSQFQNNLFLTPTCNQADTLNGNIFSSIAPFINPDFTNLNLTNLELIASSEGNNAADDGTDIGVGGGTYAWPISFHYGVRAPGLPKVASLLLSNGTIGLSDDLQIQSQGTIPSNN